MRFPLIMTVPAPEGTVRVVVVTVGEVQMPLMQTKAGEGRVEARQLCVGVQFGVQFVSHIGYKA